VVTSTGSYRFKLLKLAEQPFSDASLVRSDAANIVGILLDQIGVEIIERGAHLVRVFLVDAENDRLGEATRPFHKIRDITRDRFRTRLERDGALEIDGLILAVGYRPPIAIEVALAGTPAGCVPLGHDTVNPIGREKSVFDTLAQTVGVNWIAEVTVSIAVILPQRRRRHAQLKRRLEVTQDFTPVAVVLGAAAMTFVDDDQVEKIFRVFFVQSGPIIVLGDRLVDREV
jgi:hypothetical protein